MAIIRQRQLVARNRIYLHSLKSLLVELRQPGLETRLFFSSDSGQNIRNNLIFEQGNPVFEV